MRGMDRPYIRHAVASWEPHGNTVLKITLHCSRQCGEAQARPNNHLASAITKVVPDGIMSSSLPPGVVAFVPKSPPPRRGGFRRCLSRVARYHRNRGSHRYHRDNRNRSGSRQRMRFLDKDQCAGCGERGHWLRNCPDRHKFENRVNVCASAARHLQAYFNNEVQTLPAES